MDLRQLRYFLAVADEGNLTRAADLLHISQPTLSQQIQVLERDLGARLFDRGRGSHGVTLTPTGEVLAGEARSILAHVGRSADRLSAVARKAPVPVTLGVPVAVAAWLLAGIVEALRDEVPDVDVQLEHRFTGAQLAALASGELDLGIVRLPCHEPELRCAPLYEEPLGVWLPAGHPWARQPYLTVDQLDGQVVAIGERSIAPGAYDMVVDAIQEAGVSPRWLQVRVTPTAVGVEIRMRGLPHLGIRGLAQPTPGLVWRAVRGARLSVVTALAWHADPQPRVARCVEVALREADRVRLERRTSQLPRTRPLDGRPAKLDQRR